MSAGTYSIRPEFFRDMPAWLTSDYRCTIQVFETNTDRVALMFPREPKRQIYYAQQHDSGDWTTWRAIDNYCDHVVTNNLNDIKAPGRYLVIKSNTTAAWTGAWSGFSASTLYLKCEGRNGTITSPAHSGNFMLWQYATTDDTTANYYVRKLHNNKNWSTWVKLSDVPEVQSANASSAGIAKLYSTNGNYKDGAVTASVTSALYASNHKLISSIQLTGAITGKMSIATNGTGSISTSIGTFSLPTTKPSNPTAGMLYYDSKTHAIMAYDATSSAWLVTRNP